jgi:membrane-bound lytic murein transglycosylase B
MKQRATSQRLIIACLASLLLSPASAQTEQTAQSKPSSQVAPKRYTSGVNDFIETMSQKHGFEKKSLAALMAKARYRQEIIDSADRPYEDKPWHIYRPLFVTEERIKDGVTFWEKHAKLLQRAEKIYGVPPQIIVATIGVETKYGKFMGNYLVLDALTTLAFTYPKRQRLFLSQLESYMLLLSEEDIDPEKTMGSYAGAIGKPQFMPGSYRAYAVDFDGDGRRDLLNNSADAIGSVANFYRKHGWHKGDLVALPATVSGNNYQRYLNMELEPTTTVAELGNAGVQIKQQLPIFTKCNLIEFDVGDSKEYWLGFHNFYVITHYNHNNQYAMAVYQLSQKILDQRKARNKTNG